MADSKITALTSISTSTDPANDPLVIVDVSDTSMAATGTTKKVTLNQLLGASGTATLASATITGDLTVDTSTLKVDSTNDKVGIGTATPVQKLEVATLGSDTRVRINSTSVVCTEYFRSGTGLWLVGSDSTNAFKIARGSNFGGSADYFSIAAATADATWYDGAGGTRMTLNSTGLGVGGSPVNPITAYAAASAKAPALLLTTAGSPTYGWDFSVDGAVNGNLFIRRLVAGTKTDVLEFDRSNGNVGIGVTPSAGKGCLQLSSGINFPATAVASADANTLDDYEEGTFTATLKGTVSDPTTPVTTTARYTKIGRVVTVTIQFSSVTTTGASGRIQIDGLPFTNNSSLAGTGSVGFNGMATFTGSPFASLSASSSTIAMFASNSAGAYTAVTFNAGTTQDLWTSLTYTV